MDGAPRKHRKESMGYRAGVVGPSVSQVDNILGALYERLRNSLGMGGTSWKHLDSGGKAGQLLHIKSSVEASWQQCGRNYREQRPLRRSIRQAKVAEERRLLSRMQRFLQVAGSSDTDAYPEHSSTSTADHSGAALRRQATAKATSNEPLTGTADSAILLYA